MTDARASQAFVQAAEEGAGGDVRVTQAFVLAATQLPSEEVRASQAFVQSASLFANDVRVTQAFVLAAVKGRVANPSLKVWKITLDGHDYYGLRLGDSSTQVFDTLTKQWSPWGDGISDRLKINTMINWLDGSVFSGGYGSNIVAGDDTLGTLYFLDPEYPYDDNSLTGETDRAIFRRIIPAQVAVRGNSYTPCFNVRLTGSFGDVFDASLNTVTLYSSDDAGRTYNDHGTLTIAVGDYAARAEWRSLGSIKSPGRIFKIVNDGALARIDDLEMNI